MNAPRGVQLDLFAPPSSGGERAYLASLILDRGAYCGVCGSRAVYLRAMPPHVGAYCAGPGCGRWAKWLSARERAKAQALAQGGAV